MRIFKGKDKWRYWNLCFEIPIHYALIINNIRLEWTKNLVGPNTEIPLAQQISTVNGDIFRGNIPSHLSSQTTLLIWMHTRFNRPVQVRLGLTDWPNNWDGTEINVYQSLFHLERSSG